MVVIFKIGRRVPRNFFRRNIDKLNNILTFQEHLWSIISSSISLAKKRAREAKSDINFEIVKENEVEDLNYQIQWLTVTINGTKEQEEDEYGDLLKFYAPLKSVFDKNKFMVDDKTKNLKNMFKSKLVNVVELEKMYKAGLDNIDKNNMQNKLLEVGIMSNIEYLK